MNSKVLLALFIASGTCCVGFLWLGSRGLTMGRQIETAAVKWANKEIYPAFQNWDFEKAKPLFADEFFANNPEAKVKEFFVKFKENPGPIKQMQPFEAKGFQSNFETGKLSMVAVDLVSVAQFEKKTGDLKIKLVRTNDQWRIAAFLVP